MVSFNCVFWERQSDDENCVLWPLRKFEVQGFREKTQGFFLVGLPSRSLWRMSCSSADSWEKSMFKDIFFKCRLVMKVCARDWCELWKCHESVCSTKKKRRFRESSAREFVFFRFAWGGDLARGSHVRDSVFYFYIFTVICFISFRLWNHPEEYSRV